MPNGEHDHTFSELSSNNFVMNLTTKIVVGVENKRGEVLPLKRIKFIYGAFKNF
jgi:hypothetical protein